MKRRLVLEYKLNVCRTSDRQIRQAFSPRYGTRLLATKCVYKVVEK